METIISNENFFFSNKKNKTFQVITIDTLENKNVILPILWLPFSLEPCTVKMNMLYLINKIVATDYKQYY